MPANTRDLIKRRKGVQNTKKITHTMELISTAKLKKIADQLLASQPYSFALVQLVRQLLGAGVTLELAKEPAQTQKVALLVISSNRGLCGAYNSKLVEVAKDFIHKHQEQGINVQTHVVGKKAISMLSYRQIKIDHPIVDIDDKTPFSVYRKMAQNFMEKFYQGELHKVHVAYTSFLSIGRQELRIEQLLPLELSQEKSHEESEFLFEPSAHAVLSSIAPLAVQVNLYRMFMEAQASEQAYRMRAMKNATDNASAMIKELTRQYNRARQTKITMELLDLLGGAEAL
ncbi:MAG: ATP synthase F1 subunit gamma [Planctomycetota bacterium]|nr:MAG: ATP synthase F1 subunit gamma [Planctomycetota bacterium]